MIRVNLLKARGGPGERIQAVLNPGGPSAFISKREIVLAGLFVILGGVILATQLRLGDTDEEAMTEIAGGSDSPEALLSRPPADQDRMPRPASRPAPQPAVEPAPEPAAAPEPAVEPPAAAQTAPTPSPVEQPRPNPPPATRPETPRPRAQTPAPRPRVAAASSGAPTVTDLSIEPLDGSIEISLRTGSRQEYSTFRLDNPNRVVIDLDGLGLDLPRQMWDQSVDHPLLTRLRIALNRPDPPRVRMVLEVPEFPLVMPVLREDGLTLRLSPATQP